MSAFVPANRFLSELANNTVLSAYFLKTSHHFIMHHLFHNLSFQNMYLVTSTFHNPYFSGWPQTSYLKQNIPSHLTHRESDIVVYNLEYIISCLTVISCKFQIFSIAFRETPAKG